MEASNSSGGYLQSVKDRAAAAIASKKAPYPEPEGKEGQMAFGCAGSLQEEDCPYWDRLRWDLANSYYWSGNMVYDYFFFVCQWHPWVGILLSHPAHPWTKAERIAMLLLTIGLSIVPAAVISNGPDIDENNAAQVAVQAAAKSSATLTFITIPNVILGVILYQMSIADTRCPQCAKCCNAIKNAIFCVSFFAAGMGSFIGYVILSNVGGDKPMPELLTESALTLWDGMLRSSLLWFPLWMLLPCQLGFFSLWCAEKRAAEEGAEAAKALVDNSP